MNHCCTLRHCFALGHQLQQLCNQHSKLLLQQSPVVFRVRAGDDAAVAGDRTHALVMQVLVGHDVVLDAVRVHERHQVGVLQERNASLV
jgi:hypothetical protein